MKNAISDFTPLKSVLSSKKIVYVFGAGISSALSATRYNWYSWILAGIRHIPEKEVADGLEAEMEKDGSAASLIKVVGDVIAATKASGTYDEWMKASVGEMTLTNEGLAKTLSLTQVTRDIIATTNFDRLLEGAMGLSSLTYEQAGQAFRMIEQGQSDYVLHLHGVYDWATGTDNIVASQQQYEAIYQDEAAQFIQRLLGTRTLIFVGCGKTTDDVNISRFIEFAQKKLRIEVPCFFLKREGETAPILPDNFVVVDYGSDYADLPDFLEEMMLYRATEFMNQNPMVGRTVFEQKSSHEAWNALGKYHYAKEQLGFVGRQGELEALEGFLGADAPFSWWGITGQGGAGKSRLAYQLMKRHGGSWYSFFVRDGATPEDAKGFVPVSNTLLVFDNVQGKEKQIAEMIAAMKDKFAASGFQLRLLLLERGSGQEMGSWMENLVYAMKPCDREEFQAKRYGELITLGDLKEGAVTQLIGEVCASYHLPRDGKRDNKLRQRYWDQFEWLHYRPLFVQLFVEAWVENGCESPRYDSFDDILERVVLREQQRWLAFLKDDKEACTALVRLLVRACAGGGLSMERIPGEYAEDWRCVKARIAAMTLPGKQRQETMERFLADASQSIFQRNTMINPMYPDVIKEYMFIFYMEPDQSATIAEELWRNAGVEFSAFLHRALSDFRSNGMLIDIIEDAPNPYTNSNVLLARYALLERRMVAPNETREELAARIHKEYSFWHGMPSRREAAEDEQQNWFQLLKFRGLSLVAMQYGALLEQDAPLHEMVDCIKEAIAVPLGNCEVIKMAFLNDRIQQAAVAGFYELANTLKSLSGQVAEGLQQSQSAQDGMGDYLESTHLTELNTEMMERLFEGDYFRAYEVLKQMWGCLNRASEVQACLVAHACINLSNFSQYGGKQKYLDRSLSLLGRCKELFPESAVIHALYRNGELNEYLHNVLTLQTGYLEARAGIRGILGELQETCSNEEECNTWAMAATAFLNVAEQVHEVEEILQKTEEKLEEFDGDGGALAQAWIKMQSYLHKKRGTMAAKDTVEKAFSYVMRFPDSENTRDAFVTLLEHSQERNRREQYTNRVTDTAMLQDIHYNPLYAPQAMEQWLKLKGHPTMGGEDRTEPWEEGHGQGMTIQDFLDEIERERPQRTPYVREHAKVGANELCPCGSGKKYKKCCKGKDSGAP